MKTRILYPRRLFLVRPKARTAYDKLRLRLGREAAARPYRNPRRTAFMDERPRYEARRLAETGRVFYFPAARARGAALVEFW